MSRAVPPSEKSPDLLEPLFSQNENSKDSKDDNKLKILNGIAAALHAGLAVFVLAEGSDWKVPVVVSHVSWRKTDESLGCENANCYVELASLVSSDPYTISLSGCVAAFHFLSCVFELIPILYSKTYMKWIKMGTNPLRWAEYSLSAPVMIIPISIILGEINFLTILALMGLTSLTMIFGQLQELFLIAQKCFYSKDTDDKCKDELSFFTWFRYLPHFAGWAAQLFVWACLTTTFSISLSSSPAKPPADMYPIIVSVHVTMLTLFCCFGFVQAYQLRSKNGGDFFITELGYVALSFVSKCLLGVLVYLAIRARDRSLSLQVRI